MNRKRLFTAFSEEKQKQYEREARLQWGPDTVNESIKKWNGYGEAKQEEIRLEGGAIYADMAKALAAGKPPQDAEVQDILTRWHNHLRYFYEPTLEILRGLAEAYNTHPDFIANFQQFHPGLPEFLQAAILQYVDDLETAEIERLLAEDDRHQSS